jgi:hypothetical protein
MSLFMVGTAAMMSYTSHRATCFSGVRQDVVYVPPLPNDLQELRQRIIAAVVTINRDMLERVWTEMDYRIDVCRVTRGSHIECL